MHTYIYDINKSDPSGRLDLTVQVWLLFLMDLWIQIDVGQKPISKCHGVIPVVYLKEHNA